MKEIWKTIKGFNDYEISNFGSGLNTAAQLTKLGKAIASQLREHKANDGNFANFELK